MTHAGHRAYKKVKGTVPVILLLLQSITINVIVKMEQWRQMELSHVIVYFLLIVIRKNKP